MTRACGYVLLKWHVEDPAVADPAAGLSKPCSAPAVRAFAVVHSGLLEFRCASCPPPSGGHSPGSSWAEVSLAEALAVEVLGT